MTVNYSRLFIVTLCMVLMLPALWLQFAVIGLSTEGGPLPAGGVLGIGAVFGGISALLAFLIGVFGGLRFGLGTAGWVLALYLAGYGWLIAALAPTPVESWAVSVFNPYPIPLGVALLVCALGLGVVLIRSVKRAPKPPRTITPQA